MSIFASCGCEGFSGEDLIPVEYDDEDIDYDAGCFVPVVVVGVHCPKCVERGVSEGWLRRCNTL